MQKKEQFKVSQNTLIMTAGIVWFIAGINVLAIGIKTWTEANLPCTYKLIITILVFTTFFFCIFKPLYKKYCERIRRMPSRNHPLSFFDRKGWLIMAFMITLGICVRKFNLLSANFIAPFYTGLSIALSLTGVLFINKWFKK